jgi:hypothetical protein
MEGTEWAGRNIRAISGIDMTYHKADLANLLNSGYPFLMLTS